MKFISLFSGIGGLDLGLERAGMTCVAQVEIDDYASKVLAKHWPSVIRFRDVRDCGAHNLPPADLICGGFPCQDISYAGKGAGLSGERSGLWYEFARIICEVRPRYVLVENVAALLTRGLSDVLSTLASFGYDAEWQCIPAAALGAPHRRDRVFIIAYSDSIRSHSIFRFKPTKDDGTWRNVASRTAKAITAGNICGDDDGLPYRVERLRGLGNAVVPQVAQFIGECIMDYDRNNKCLEHEQSN